MYEGAEVSIYYDPMISKLAAWGRTRTEAIDRLRRALDEYKVGGIKTTLPFFREIVRDEEFIEGRLDTNFIPRFNERRRNTKSETTNEQMRNDMALIAAVLAYEEKSGGAHKSQQSGQSQSDAWRRAGRTALHRAREIY